MKNKKLLLIVLLPLLTLLLLITRAELHLQQGQIWQFKVQGYDPRDLLRGHYLRFQLSYNWQNKQVGSCAVKQNCCLCLTDTGKAVPAVQKMSCDIAKNQCDGTMNFALAKKLNRFYIAENKAKKAENILREARINDQALLSISINADGTPMIVDLLIDGQSLNERLKEE